MSDQTHPVVMCDGEGGMCGAVELDFTLGGLGRIIGSESQLPDGWTGTKPGDGGEHYCPDCTRARVDQIEHDVLCPHPKCPGGGLCCCLSEQGGQP